MNILLKSLILSFFLISGTGCTDKNEMDSSDPGNPATEQSVRIKTAHGDIVFKLLPNVAPITVTRIQELVKVGFYNGLIFHRVIPGFVIQGGDPSGTGSGGSGKKLKAEFSDLVHEKGSVAMARAQDINSADSQFYISLGKHPHLDGKYTIFGKVTEGMDVLDKVKQGDKMLSVTLE